MYRKVLAAFDRDDAAGSELVARRCASLSKQCGSEIFLIHVRPLLPGSYIRHLPQDWEADQCGNTQAWLRELAGEHGFDDQVSDVSSPAGSVSGEVVRMARDNGVDAIVVAAHRMTIGRLILGSNAHAITRDAPCDVLLVRDVET